MVGSVDIFHHTDHIFGVLFHTLSCRLHTLARFVLRGTPSHPYATAFSLVVSAINGTTIFCGDAAEVLEKQTVKGWSIFALGVPTRRHYQNAQPVGANVFDLIDWNWMSIL
jgi:hypothetical protein